MRVPIPVQLVTGALDVFHSPDFVLPPTGRTPTILTVHDLSCLRVPECFVPGFSEYLDGAVSRAVRRAGHILADSKSTRRDLFELMDVAHEQVTVVYPGVAVPGGYYPSRTFFMPSQGSLRIHSTNP